MVTGRQANPAGLESHRSTPAASDPHQTKRAASERSFRLGDSWSLRGLEGGFSRDGNGELGKENDGGREKQVERKGEKGRVKSMGNKGDRNVQEDKEGDDEWDKEEGDEKEESRSLDEGEDEMDGESKQFHVSDDLELVLSHGQARVRRRLAERRQTRARLADCVPCTSDNDGEESKLQGFQSGQGGERDENAGGGDSGSELEGSRKLLQESAPCCDPLVLKLRVERRMGQIAEKQVSFDEQVRFDEQAESNRVSREKYVLNKKLSRADANWEALFLSNQSMHEAQMTVQRCNGHGIVAQQGTLVWKGYTCDAADEALRQYTSYDASGACPDDWFATQSLIFQHRCFSLPQRRCRARTTNQTISALFNLSALIDGALVWDHHTCSSFACLPSSPILLSAYFPPPSHHSPSLPCFPSYPLLMILLSPFFSLPAPSLYPSPKRSSI
ncbi:unnamed protein product [Closterium sp. Naga37s-1]|nr:unnamed protein product [Closterium sp. Naga37s-1]